MDDELLPRKSGVRSGPGLEAAPAVVDLLRGALGEVEAAVFAGEDGRERGGEWSCGCGVMRSLLRGREGLDHQLRADLRELWIKLGGGGVGADGNAVDEQHIAGVEARVERMVVTPVSVSPLATAHWMGAAPRYLGSSEPWRLMLPKRGRSSIQCGMMRP